MKKYVLLLLTITAFSNSLLAQRYMGVATGNWNVVNSLYLNPANIVDSRTRGALDLPGMNFLLDNNAVSFDFSSALGGKTSGFSFSNAKAFSGVLPYLEVRPLGLMVNINHNNSIAFTTRVRLFNQFNDLDQTLYNMVFNKNPAGQPITVNAPNFNWTAHAWAEMGLTYGRIIYENKEHMVKAGLTVRYLSGIMYMAVKGSITGTLDTSNYTLAMTNSSLEYSSNLANSSQTFVSDPGALFSNMFGGAGAHGFGIDAGVVYEWRPDYKAIGEDGSANKYRLRASFALTDMGSIEYKTGNDDIKASGNGYMDGHDTGLLKSLMSSGGFKDYAANHGFTYTSSPNTPVKLGLPTALVMGVDAYIWSHFYANATFVMNTADRTAFGNSFYNNLTITPRWDTKWISLAVPISYNMLSNSLKAGVGVKITGFYIGTDDLLLLKYGANFYMGAYIYISKSKPKKEKEEEKKTDELVPPTPQLENNK